MREWNDQQRVDVHRAEQLFLLRKRENLLRHAIGRDDRQRMRMKRDDRRWPSCRAGLLDDAADDLLMADVHAVEVADCCDAPAREIGLPQWVVEDQHWARSLPVDQMIVDHARNRIDQVSLRSAGSKDVNDLVT